MHEPQFTAVAQNQKLPFMKLKGFLLKADATQVTAPNYALPAAELSGRAFSLNLVKFLPHGL